MMKAISLLFEMLSVLMVLHGFMQRRFSVRVGTVLFLLFDIVGFCLIDKELIPYYSQIFIYVVFALYLWYEFRGEKVLKVIISTILSLFVIGGLQLAVFLLLFAVPNKDIHYNLVNPLMLGIIFVAVYSGLAEKVYNFLKKATKRIILVLIFVAVVSVVALIVIRVAPDFTFLETVLLLVVFFLVFVFGQQWSAERDRVLAKEREFRLMEQCRDSFEQLITDVRMRQHEFDNQFDALCGLRFSCTTFEEMKEKLNDALDYVYKDNRFNKLLTLSCSPLIKGFLYANFCKASENNIDIDYEINLSEEYSLPVEFDIQEIVGILFDNACEAMMDLEKQALRVSLKDEDNILTICVENISPYISQKEIQSFFKLSYSSKGSNRGYGLYNVKRLVKKYNGEITTGNIEKQGENRFFITAKLTNLCE